MQDMRKYVNLQIWFMDNSDIILDMLNTKIQLIQIIPPNLIILSYYKIKKSIKINKFRYLKWTIWPIQYFHSKTYFYVNIYVSLWLLVGHQPFEDQTNPSFGCPPYDVNYIVLWDPYYQNTFVKGPI